MITLSTPYTPKDNPNNPRNTSNATTSKKSLLSPKQANVFHKTNLAASKKLSHLVSKVNQMDYGLVLGLDDSNGVKTKVAPTSSQTKTLKEINKNIADINVTMDDLSKAKTSKEASSACTNIATKAQNIIDFLHRDLVDLQATKLIKAGDTQAGNALLVRGARIEAGQNVITPLRKLVKVAQR